MTTFSSPSPAAPPDPDSLGTVDAVVLIVVVCFACGATCLIYVVQFLLYYRDLHRGRPAREPKPPTSDDSDGACPVHAGVWAEAECAICLAALIDDVHGLEERVRVRVLPACGHGFHAACPTCRAPSSSRTTSA